MYAYAQKHLNTFMLSSRHSIFIYRLDNLSNWLIGIHSHNNTIGKYFVKKLFVVKFDTFVMKIHLHFVESNINEQQFHSFSF